MAERAHSHIERSCRPHLMQWVLQQEAPRKQVLLQVLTGTPERECASRLNMTLEQVRSIEQWFVRESPLFVEDDYAMSYQAARSLEEFCRVTRQDECVYHLMELRHPRSTRATRTAVTTSQEPRANARPSSSSVPANHLSSPSLHEDEAAKKRREERRAAREQERVRRLVEAATEAAPERKAELKRKESVPSLAHQATRPPATPHPARAPQPQQPAYVIAHNKKEHSKELAKLAETICEQSALRSMRPISFPDFLRSYRRECNTRGWTLDAAAGDSTPRHMLEHDGRVMWMGTDEFWFFDWKEYGRAISRVIENDALVDHEYSTRFFYRKERELMRKISVKTPDELYEILRRIYVDTQDEAVFGNHLSFGFGKIDRQRQVKQFVAKHAGEPKSILAMEYEREYGFSAGTAEIWIDLFARPDDVSLSSWIGHEAVGKETSQARISTQPVKEQSSIKAQTAPEPQPATITVTDFLKRELTGDICDAGLIRARFKYEFPNKPDITRNTPALEKAGYYESHCLFFKAGATPTDYFTQLLSSHPSFSRGDPGFEEAVWKHPDFHNLLDKMLSSHQVLLYERPDSYITFSRLHKVLGANLEEIESYAPAVIAVVPKMTPFTIHSLRNSLGFDHPLHGMEMPDAFYEGLLDISGLFGRCVLAGTEVFVPGKGTRFSTITFIEWLVSTNEGIYREDMPRLLQKEYGIDYPMASLITTVYNSSIFHDDVDDAYYSSLEVWKQEVSNELA